jgi:hypothetical protein
MYGYSGSPSRGYGLFVMDSNDEVYSVIDGYDGRYTILAVTWSSVPIEE